jgi:hypothetical protein
MLVLACGDSPTAYAEQEAFAPSFEVLGASGCYKVEIHEYDVPDPPGGPQVPGVLSGDLIGTSTFTDWSGGWTEGAAFLDSFTLIWDITGTIPELTQLVDETLYVFVKAASQFAPGQDPVFPITAHGTMAHDDVELGKLTSHGVFDTSTIPPALDGTWKGVICL